MKRILLLLVLFFTLSSYADYKVDIYKYDNFMKSLKLSEKQTKKLEQIENNYNKKITLLNSEILLNDMQVAQLRVNKNNFNLINSLKIQSNALKEELNEITKEKQQKISSILNIFQRYKYKKYISKIN